MVGYNVRCKLCNCDKRAEAEKLHEDGLSLQRVVDFLSAHDITLSKAAVKRHFDTHFAPKEEAAKRFYEQSQIVEDQAVEKRMTNLEMLEATAIRNYQLHLLATDSVTDSLTKEFPLFNPDGEPAIDPETGKQLTRKYAPPKPIVDLLTGSAGEMRQAIKLQAELLGDIDPSVKVVFIEDLEDG